MKTTNEGMLVLSGSIMWLLTLVLAFSASISACESPYECTNNTKQNASFSDIECLDKLMIGDLPLCDCRSATRNATSAALEVECFNGVPLIDTLPSNVQKLVIHGIYDHQLMNMLMELENTSLACLSELIITNSSFVESNVTWLHFPRLVTLNVSVTNLTELSDLRIGNGSDVRVLDLSRNQLSELPAEAFRTLTGLACLSLRVNAIQSVDENAFAGLTELKELDISDNKLALLPDNTLSHLASLQTLNLSGNQLRILGARWFEALGRLRELDVSRNSLTKAVSGVLQPLPGLSVLRLAENPLMERDVSLLLGTGRRLETVDASRTGLVRVPAALTRSVRALRLAGNKLTCIWDGDFDGYPLLKILDLSDNLLNDVEEDSLGRLETLEHLDLSGNQLRIVPRSLPDSLILLNLRGNHIKTLTFNDLQGIDNLRRLLLNDNTIERIEEGALSQLPLLTELDISYNPIKQLPANALAGPTKLVDLRMSGLTYLEWENEQRGDMAFPVPMPEMLVSLDVSYSPALAAQLLSDSAALSASKSLHTLNLINTNLTSIRSDLLYLLPQLRVLGLSENDWNCTADLLWLGEWIRQHQELKSSARCSNSTSDFANIPLVSLPDPPTTTTTSTTTVSSTISDSSYHFENEKYPDFEVPNASSYPSNISTTKLTNLTTEDTTAALDEIPTSLSPEVDVTSSTKLGNHESTEIPMVTQSGIQKVNDFKRKSKKKVNNERLQIHDKTIKRTTIGSQRTNDHGEFISERRQKLQGVRDNRVDSFEYNENVPVKSHSKAHVTKNTEVLKTIEFRSSNKIIWDLTGSSSVPETRDELIDETMKKNSGNFVLTNDIAHTIAEELNGHSTESDIRPVTGITTHPGMLVLIGAIIGAAAALTVVLSRRATLRRRDRYHRHENIEVHTLTPTTELW